MKIGDLCTYASKSSIKAGEAINNGKYMFFTSGTDENKRYSDYQLDCEAIIMGTGGNATLHYYNGKFSTSTDCVVLIPNEYIRCKYLYYFFLYNINVLENGFKGAGLKHTNKNYMRAGCRRRMRPSLRPPARPCCTPPRAVRTGWSPVL